MALVDPSSQKVLSGFQSDRGCKVVFQESLDNQIEPTAFFAQELRGLIRQNDIQPSQYQEIIISGMASSSIGMKELPYATLPFSLDGSGVRSELMEIESLGKVNLISGVSDRADIMRGEETQLLGLREKLYPESSILIFPGTHSKHMQIRNGELIGFKTFLTGELFQLVGEQSVLNRSMMKSQWSADFKGAFNEGVEDAQKKNLLNSLFRIRASDILGKRKDKHQNYFYLSGLIIGSELKNLIGNTDPKVFACDEKMKPIYEQAVECLGIGNSTFLATSDLTNAFIFGQLSILNHL